jgi:preprotein translocase subunit SecF
MTDASPRTNLDFMKLRHVALWVSVALIMISVVALGLRGLNFGLDFTGGTLLEVGFQQPVASEEMRVALTEGGFENAVVQTFGSERELLIRVPPQEDVDQALLADEVTAFIARHYAGMDLRRAEFVGPAVGEELRESGGLAMLVALAAVLIYIMFRFAGKFAVGSVIALVHDVIIIFGAFAIMQWTFDLPALAAVLAVIGYSLNDTIVVYDRIRENFRTIRRATPVETINISLNQVLNRTLVTSFTTLLVLVSLLVFGGAQVQGFADALIVGVVVGTYSSIYVAANVLVMTGVSRDDLLVPEKEREEIREG